MTPGMLRQAVIGSFIKLNPLYMMKNAMPSHYPSYLKRYFSFSRIPFLNWTGRNIR